MFSQTVPFSGFRNHRFTARFSRQGPEIPTASPTTSRFSRTPTGSTITQSSASNRGKWQCKHKYVLIWGFPLCLSGDRGWCEADSCSPEYPQFAGSSSEPLDPMYNKHRVAEPTDPWILPRTGSFQAL